MIKNFFVIRGNVVEMFDSKGRIILVDFSDWLKICEMRWNAAGRYAQNRKRPDNPVLLHRFITEYSQVDHINRNKLDNRQVNLRQCSTSENAANAKKRQGTTSRWRGVSYDKNRKKWSATLQVMDKQINIGRFDHEEDAAMAYNEKALEHFREYAFLNEYKGGIYEEIIPF